jgi:MoaA/NifB/PqqE/SkfB family radical SAM enzyme
MLTKSDQITFSIDGWDNASNNLYRVNSNWDSIMLGLATLNQSSKCRLKWSAIYFNFNQDKILDMLQIARQHGVDVFETVRSSKFGYQYFEQGIDPLAPSKEFVSTSAQYQKQAIFVTHHPITVKLHNTDAHPWAQCLRWTKELFINVDGLVFPCPWFNSGYQENDFVQKYASRMSIKTRPLLDILADPMWDEFITRIETMPLEVCKMKCRDCK